MSANQHRVLLTVSGNIPADLEKEIAAGDRPRVDYLEMARGFGADLIDYQTAAKQTGLFGRLLQQIGGENARLAWACYRQRNSYDTIFTDGEQVGLPYALFCRFFGWMAPTKASHLMITHRLTPRNKTFLIDRFKLHRLIDRFIVYSSHQQSYIRERWALSEAHVPLTPFMVDHQFFSAEACAHEPDVPGVTDLDKPILCSIGREYRDYPTLIEAVKGLDLHLFVATSSLWSKRDDHTAEERLPDNVTVMRFTYRELRQLYNKCDMVIVPLVKSDFQAGVTTILEGMALGKPIICSQTIGQNDVIEDQVDGIYVAPEDPVELRKKILALLSAADLKRKLGQNSRRKIETEMNIYRYVDRLNELIHPKKRD